jgi:hypothetical protein
MERSGVIAPSGVSFWQEVTRDGRAKCFLCEVFPGEKGQCAFLSSGLDAHHVIPKQLLKREFRHGARCVLRKPGAAVEPWEPSPRDWESEPGWDTLTLDQILWDPRDGIPLGRYHHNQIEHDHARIPRELLPPAVEDFAAEMGLGWRLDHDYGRAAA